VSGRQGIADILAEVVSEMRAQLDGDELPPEERGNLLGSYVLASHLWNSVTARDQALAPGRVAGGLQQLLAHCQGPLSGCRPLVEAALTEAETLDWEFRTA
jgi:hypothetical protein